MKKLITMMLMLASVFFFGCEDEEEYMAPEEAKAALEQVGTNISTTMEQMQSTEGMEAMGILINLPDPFAQTMKSNARTAVIPNIHKFLLPSQPEKTKSAYEVTEFNFDAWVGTYSWNNTYQQWDVTHGTPNDKIIVNFPSDSTDMGTNDATLTIYNYDEISIELYDEYYGNYTEYFPTNVHADLYVKSVKAVEITLTATWVTTGDAAGEPTSLDISVYLIPYEFTGEFSHSSNSAKVDFTIKYQENTIFAAGVGAVFESNNMEDSPININGYLQLFNVKFVASVDLKDLETAITNMQLYESEQAMIDALNAEISAYVTVDGVKAADIKLALRSLTTPSDLPFDIVFVYSDGTTESAIVYFMEFGEDLDSFFTFLDDYYGDWK